MRQPPRPRRDQREPAVTRFGGRLRLAAVFVSVFLAGCAVIVREAKQGLIRVHPAGSSAGIAITLDDAFIEAYKDRVTIDVSMTVDRADTRPHPAAVDGDFHLAGNSPGIGLPFVAEIQNSAKEKSATDLVRGVAGTGRPIPVAGVWRIWAEHARETDQIQGEQTASVESTNPDHIFEIHPVLRAAGIDLIESLRPVKGYRPGSANLVFRGLEKLPCRISTGEKTTTVETPGTRLNDAEFLLQAGSEPHEVAADGTFVFASVLDLKGNVLVPRVRTVFVKDSPPERAVLALPPGGRLRVFGLPRIDLAEVASRVARSREQPALLDGGLPYEIIVSGVYDDRK